MSSSCGGWKIQRRTRSVRTGQRGVADVGHVLSRAAMVARDLCAVTAHLACIWKLLPRNPDTPFPRRCTMCARTHLYLTEYFKSYRSATMRAREPPRAWISMRRARIKILLLVNHRGDILHLASHSDILLVAVSFYKNFVTL